MPDLRPDGGPVRLGRVTIRSPGLAGQVEVVRPRDVTVRGGRRVSEPLLDVLTEVGLTEQLSIVVSNPGERRPSAGTRGGGVDEDILIEVPGPGPELGQVLLHRAENGNLSWHFPVRAPGVTDGQGALVYRVPRAVLPLPPDSTARRVRRVLEKVLTLFAFRLLEPGVGLVADGFAAAWERVNRPYGLHSHERLVGSADAGLGRADLARLGAGPVLLLIHGMFSTSRAGFGSLPAPLLDELVERYDGRVVAFDHPSIGSTPTANVRWLARRLPPAARITVDVLAHSRGGLVARELCERAGEAGLTKRLRVRTAVLVGTPNSGTALADPANWRALLDRFTNLVRDEQRHVAQDLLASVVALLKQLAVGAVGGLDGIAAMDPGGWYLTGRLNQPSRTAVTYRAVTADFRPPPGSPLRPVLMHAAADAVFGDLPNDLVVPTDGVFAANGSTSFPIAEPLVFRPADGVHHSGFWTKEAFRSSLLGWLEEPPTVARPAGEAS